MSFPRLNKIEYVCDRIFQYAAVPGQISATALRRSSDIDVDFCNIVSLMV